MNKPLIFITNDDGIRAKGIGQLIEMLRPLGDLLVIAPDGPRSGNSNALSMENPVVYTLQRQEPGLTIYSCSGTPTDCAKLAFYIGDRHPDFFFSGINHGRFQRVLPLHETNHLLNRGGSIYIQLIDYCRFHHIGFR